MGFIAPKASTEGACILTEVCNCGAYVMGYYGACIMGYYGTCMLVTMIVYERLLWSV